jgi:hypothetical protein
VRRVLLDENLPRLLKRDLPGLEVRTVAKLDDLRVLAPSIREAIAAVQPGQVLDVPPA